MSTPVPLWRQMHASATAAPPSADGPAHRYASILDVVAGFLCVHGYEEAAFLLLDESAKALEGK